MNRFLLLVRRCGLTGAGGCGRGAWLVGLTLVAVTLPARVLAAASPLLEKVDLFAEGQAGFVSYRIPGVVVTAKGTVLAYCEARKFTSADRGEIEIHLRRSTDGGRTWSPQQQIAHRGPRLPRNPHMPDDKKRKDMGGPEQQTVNNPMLIPTREGPVHFVYCVEYMRAFRSRSDDDGVTWSEPVEITATFDRKNVSIHVSRDDGRTWPVRQLLQAGPSAYSDLAVLPDGTILCFYESGKPGETRRGGDWAYARLTVARFSLEWLGAGR